MRVQSTSAVERLSKPRHALLLMLLMAFTSCKFRQSEVTADEKSDGPTITKAELDAIRIELANSMIDVGKVHELGKVLSACVNSFNSFSYDFSKNAVVVQNKSLFLKGMIEYFQEWERHNPNAPDGDRIAVTQMKLAALQGQIPSITHFHSMSIFYSMMQREDPSNPQVENELAIVRAASQFFEETANRALTDDFEVMAVHRERYLPASSLFYDIAWYWFLKRKTDSTTFVFSFEYGRFSIAEAGTLDAFKKGENIGIEKQTVKQYQSAVMAKYNANENSFSFELGWTKSGELEALFSTKNRGGPLDSTVSKLLFERYDSRVPYSEEDLKKRETEPKGVFNVNFTAEFQFREYTNLPENYFDNLIREQNPK